MNYMGILKNINKPKQKGLFLCNSMRDVKKHMKVLQTIFQNNEIPFKVNMSENKFEFPNGSTLIVLPQEDVDRIRGTRLTNVVYDDIIDLEKHKNIIGPALDTPEDKEDE